MKKFDVLILFGTRPELIKLAPLIYQLKKNPVVRLHICFSGQHPDMINPLLSFFDIKPNITLDIQRSSSSLGVLTRELIDKLTVIFNYHKFDLTIVQGDTTSSFIGGLVSFYHRVPIAHVEAGLRSGNKYSPFPEEMNRLLLARLSDLHFAPTEKNAENLRREGVEKNIWITGNTVIDSLFLTLEILNSKKELQEQILEKFPILKEEKRIILVTVHRRENWGKPLENISDAIRELALMYPSYNFVIPMHKNPDIRKILIRKIGNLDNVFLIEPLNYPELVYFLGSSYLVLTDSGGLQEEAPSFGKPVLVLRDNTERTEGIEEGVSFLVGTDRRNIVEQVVKFLENQILYKNVSQKRNPYGDGKASERIAKIILDFLKNEK